MPVGHLTYVIECQANTVLGASVAPCVDISGSFTEPVIVQRYVIDVSQQSYFDGLDQGFDYAVASQLFVFGFSGLISLWALGISAKYILSELRPK